jgi:hypothetical protein
VKYRRSLTRFVMSLAMLLILTAPLSDAQSGPGRHYYVAPTGSDSNNGSLARPWNSIGHAVLHSGPGDTVFLRAGTYSEKIEMRGDPGNQYQRVMGGSAAGRWTLQSYPGETAILAAAGFAAYSVQYATFQNLHFTGGKGLYVGTADWLTPPGPRSHHIEIRNNTFSGPQARYGFIEAMFDNSLIEGNVIASTAGGETTDHGIYLHHGDGNTLRANTITAVSGYGIHIYDERKRPGDKATSITNVIVESNTLAGSRRRSGLIISQGDDTAVDGVLIRNNILYNNAAFGIDLTNYGTAKMSNLRIHHNTIHGNVKGGITVGKSVTASEARNNIIDVPPSAVHVDTSVSGSIGLVLGNNVYWPSPARVSGLVDTNSVVGDPGFVNPDAGNFRIEARSAAVGRVPVPGAYRN